MTSPWGHQIPDLSGKILSFEEKSWLVERVNNLLDTPAELQSKYKIPQDTIRKWVRTINSGAKFNSNGRPRVVSLQFYPKIEKLVNSGPFNIESTVLHDELHKLAIETTQSRKKVAESQVKRPSNRTVGRICKSLNIKSGNAELTTNARAIACADVRNAVSMCAAQHLMVPLVDHYLILNLPIHALTWFQLDGEAIQIECYQSPEMIQLLNENFVVVGKPATCEDG